MNIESRIAQLERRLATAAHRRAHAPILASDAAAGCETLAAGWAGVEHTFRTALAALKRDCDGAAADAAAG